jgi:hypothetical protein
MWELLHSSAFIFDANKTNIDSLVEPLRSILPCRYCRDSFVLFYEDLGRPHTGSGLKWTFDVHNLVNKKLAKQRQEAFAKKYSSQSKHLEQNYMDLASTPSLEIVQKRLLVNSDELLSWKSISIVLLALAMANVDQHKLKDFVMALQKAIFLSKQGNSNDLRLVLDEFLLSSDKRKFIDDLKYGQKKHYSELIRAGACMNGTCN